MREGREIFAVDLHLNCAEAEQLRPPHRLPFSAVVVRLLGQKLLELSVSRDRREKFLRFLVDDGTGCIPCVLWLNHQYLNANNSSRVSDSDPTAEMALKMSEEVHLGTLLRVRGKIAVYRGAIQITVRDVVLEKDPNVEVLHWLQCVRMAKECYDFPPSAQQDS
ncbi:hypothetical protein PR202_ga25644 [Eleusine coracana subsp. coracana]|uniref:CST complex subunit STN1 n=1 Tax=Eleusine coracana subsp. coracana TaxID=191504 RepID=A0AAV5D9V4_ELECO|nr:hypothetical protein PR202_ga25644 [Eleusine coracana subsp. coracana]